MLVCLTICNQLKITNMLVKKCKRNRFAYFSKRYVFGQS